MGNKLPPDQLAFYKRTDEILYYVWDPIGISDLPRCRDEYQNYLPQIFKLSMENDDPIPIAEYLNLIQVDRMGIAPNTSHDLKIAQLLLDVKEEIIEYSQ